MDEVDHQIMEIERREAARREASQAARDLPGFGGAWIEDERLFVSVTWLPEHAEITLRPAAHSLADLEALMAAVEAEAERMLAPLSSIGVDQRDNALRVNLRDLECAASRALMEHFAGEPILWGREIIVTN